MVMLAINYYDGYNGFLFATPPRTYIQILAWKSDLWLSIQTVEMFTDDELTPR